MCSVEERCLKNFVRGNIDGVVLEKGRYVGTREICRDKRDM